MENHCPVKDRPLGRGIHPKAAGMLTINVVLNGAE